MDDAPRSVVDPAAIRVVLDPERRRYLEPFLGRTRSIAEAAAEVGATVEATAYRVHHLAEHGLVAVVGTRARKGRPIALYRAADRLQIPLAAVPEADVTSVFEVIDAGARTAFLRALARQAGRAGIGDWVVRFARGPDDGIRLDMVPADGRFDAAALTDPAAPAVVFNWVPVRTTPEQAKALQRRIADLVAELPVDTGAPTHLVGVFLTPLGP